MRARRPRTGRRGGHIGSRALERRVEHEYERKGISRQRSEYIGGAVAGKVNREQMAKRKRARGF